MFTAKSDQRGSRKELRSTLETKCPKLINPILFITHERRHSYFPGDWWNTRKTWRTFWASTYKINLRRLVILQKRIIRIINKSHFNAHIGPIFRDLGILKFDDIHLLQLGQIMYSCKNSFLPPRFNNNFSQRNQFHSYNTRNSQAYRLPYCRTNTKKFSPFFQGPKFFNSLDNEVINSQSLSSFKKKLKIKLLSKYENSS